MKDLIWKKCKFKTMTAKEKAEELIDTFYFPSLKWAFIHAKECALKAVDVIINTIEYSSQADEMSKKSYWKIVKQEIEKL